MMKVGTRVLSLTVAGPAPHCCARGARAARRSYAGATLPMNAGMGPENLALVRGMDDTRAALRRWSDRPWSTLGEWAGKALLVACGLLLAVYVVANLSTPDLTPIVVPGVTRPARGGDLGFVLLRNATVLALHAFACVAGFIAGSSMPLEAAQRRGAWKTIHDWSGPLAIWFVCSPPDSRSLPRPSS